MARMACGPSKEYPQIARACEMGAEGIMLPMVGNAKEAGAILDCMKYHPDGKRGVALGVAHDAYTGGAVPKKLAAANERTTLFCQIETAEGVKNADSIAAIDGVDCLWVGHFDLSVSLGIPGEFDNPKFKQAIAKTIAATRKHKKALGRLVPTVEQGIELYAQGFDFVCYSSDVWVLNNALVITPDGVRRPVAVSIMTLMLALAGKLMVKDRLTREAATGFARRSDHMGIGLVGRTLASLGIGNIGAELFRLATPFDMKFIAHDPYADKSVAAELGVELVSIEDAFRRADILSVSAPLSPATRHLVDAER